MYYHVMVIIRLMHLAYIEFVKICVFICFLYNFSEEIDFEKSELVFGSTRSVCELNNRNTLQHTVQ